MDPEVSVTREIKIDVALSFAAEDRSYVEMVVEQLKARGVSFFYDYYQQADLWGKDLYEHLVDVYRNRAQYTVMFVSKYYREKLWTNHERRAAQSRALEESREYILPARFDDTDIPGLLPTTAFVDLRLSSPVQVALLLCDKLGRNPFSLKAHQVPCPRNPALKGEVSFDYSSHNGYFRIGEGHFAFDTRWSKRSNTLIACYTDSPNIRGVALAPRGADLGSLPAIDTLDFTSRVRTAEVGRLVVLQNTYGIYAVIEIVEIKDDTRGDPEDNLRFKYWIMDDGSSNFSVLPDTP